MNRIGKDRRPMTEIADTIESETAPRRYVARSYRAMNWAKA